MMRRVVPRHACISPEEANRIATEHSELFQVEVTEDGEGTWKYFFRSPIGNSITSMEATDSLGWRYQLDRWERETEQELASAPSIDTAISHSYAFWRRALGVNGYVEVKLEEMDSTSWKVVWPSGREETLDRPRRLLDWLRLLKEKT